MSILDDFDPPDKMGRGWRKGKASTILKKNRAEKRAAWIQANPTVGKWAILGMAANKENRSYVHCRCACGAEHDVIMNDLKAGRSKQCSKCARLK